MLTQQQLQQSFQNATQPRINAEINFVTDEENNIISGTVTSENKENVEMNFNFIFHPDKKCFIYRDSDHKKDDNGKIISTELCPISKDNLLKDLTELFLKKDTDGNQNNKKYEISIFQNKGTNREMKLSYEKMGDLLQGSTTEANYNPYRLNNYWNPEHLDALKNKKQRQ